MTPVQLQDKTRAAYTTENILTTLGYPDPLVAAQAIEAQLTTLR